MYHPFLYPPSAGNLQIETICMEATCVFYEWLEGGCQPICPLKDPLNFDRNFK